MKPALVLATLVLAAASLRAADVPAAQRMVVVISLDGLPAYALDDPKLPVPTLRRLQQEGLSGRMTIVNPTVTWPNHTTLVTGVTPAIHRVLANGTIHPAAEKGIKVDYLLDQPHMVHAPTVYDAAFKAGLTTAQVDWVAINNAPTITWAFSEWATPEGPLEKEMLAKGAVTAAELDRFSKSNIVFRDQVWTRAAAYLIREHRPNLLLFHLLSLDSTHHRYGPRTLAGLDSMAFLDSSVEKIIAAVREAGMMERTTFLVLSDHGFKSYTKEIRPLVALSAAGLAGKVRVMPEGGTAFVYCPPELVAPAREALAKAEGIHRVISPEEFPSLGLPTPAQDPQAFQLLLAARDGYSFSGATGGPVSAELPQQGGGHGYLASDPEMDAIFIASGYGVVRGRTLTQFPNVNVAPTIAKLLGIALPSAQGQPVPLN
jgi:predicted AlkP superfamily pyrophosphatase or phosphodiesterase